MRLLMICIMLLGSVLLPAQDSQNWIKPTIDIITSLVSANDNSECNLPTLKMVRANKKKGSLMRKYNRWLERDRITQQQYDSLISELLGIPLMDYKQIILHYEQKVAID